MRGKLERKSICKEKSSNRKTVCRCVGCRRRAYIYISRTRRKTYFALFKARLAVLLVVMVVVVVVSGSATRLSPRTAMMIALALLRSIVSHGVSARPFFGVAYRLALVDLPEFGHVVGKRIVRIRGAQQRLYRQKHRPNLQRRRPLVFQNI